MAEVEERITRIGNHKGVNLLLIVNENERVLRFQQSSQDSSATPQQIATAVTDLAKKARSVVRDIDPMNDMTFFRVRAKRKEILVAPDKHLFLIVMQETDFEQWATHTPPLAYAQQWHAWFKTDLDDLGVTNINQWHYPQWNQIQFPATEQLYIS